MIPTVEQILAVAEACCPPGFRLRKDAFQGSVMLWHHTIEAACYHASARDWDKAWELMLSRPNLAEAQAVIGVIYALQRALQGAV